MAGIDVANSVGNIYSEVEKRIISPRWESFSCSHHWI